MPSLIKIHSTIGLYCAHMVIYTLLSIVTLTFDLKINRIYPFIVVNMSTKLTSMKMHTTVLSLSCSQGPSVMHRQTHGTCTIFSKSDWWRDLKHSGDKYLDLLSFPTKNLIFQHSIFNISGFLKLKFIKFWDVHLNHYTYFRKMIFFNSCIEVND